MADMDKGAILAKTKRRVEAVEVEDGTVYVRSLTLREVNKWEAGNVVMKNGQASPNIDGQDARFAVLVVCDKDGTRVFNDEDAAQVTHLDAGFMEPILKAARKLNGMGAVEEVKGN